MVNKMKEIIEKIKKLLDKSNNIKFINNLFIILLVAIIFLIVVNNFLKPKVEKAESTTSLYKDEYTYDIDDDYSEYLEKKLSKILSELKGVGVVNVMITLENSAEKMTANNTTKSNENTKEEDSEGGIRQVIREDTTTQVVTKGNNDGLLIVKEIKPIVQGVLVVAEGAEDPVVKEILYEAVKTVLGIKGNKVQVYSSK